VFRNHLTGFRRDYAGLSNGRAAGLNYGSWWHSFVGNVLGVSGGMSGWVYENLGTGSDPSDPFGGPPSIWKLGYQAGEWEQSADPKVLSTVLRGGNYDYLTSSVHWENLTPQTLPNSLYLSAKPSFLGSTPWPPIGPDVSGFVSAIPARACFDQGKMPNCNRVGGSFSPAGLSVDSATVAGSSSNANGVLEPGETVLVKPSWRNGTATPASATGSASGPDGPAGATYGLPDAAAMYATIAGGSVGDCGSNCYLFSVTNPATRPRQHWDAVFTETLSTTAAESWTLHVGRSFSDVSVSDPAYRFVETLFHRGVTAGCGGTSFCPLGDVTRQQMAVLLLVSKEGQPYSPPACVTPVFGDVPCSSGFARWIDELANRGVTAGCAGGNFCPLAKVTRAQMSVFLLRTLEGSAYTPPACATPSFADVPCSSPFARWIDELNARGIASGCGGGDFCPNANVSRGQMAVFLTVTFGLSL